MQKQRQRTAKLISKLLNTCEICLLRQGGMFPAKAGIMAMDSLWEAEETGSRYEAARALEAGSQMLAPTLRLQETDPIHPIGKQILQDQMRGRPPRRAYLPEERKPARAPARTKRTTCSSPGLAHPSDRSILTADSTV